MNYEEPLPQRTRWCPWCRDTVTNLGSHYPDGHFDPFSVPVSRAELSASMRTYHGYSRAEPAIRLAIALGKHIGTRF